MKRLFLPFILLTIFMSGSFCYSQSDTISKQKVRKTTKVWSLSFEQGAMLGNGTELGDQLIESSYYNGVDLHLGFSKNNHKDVYNQVYRLPVLGLGWYASTFHNADVGKPNALYFFFNMPMSFERNKKFTMSYIGAFGLSYNFNPYDEMENPSNLFVGSYRNCYVNFSFLLNYHFNPKWVTHISLGFKHFSNGSFKLPNSGINLIPVSIGVTYKPSEFKPFEGERDLPEFIKNNQINIALSAGSKNYVIGDPNYLKAVIGINWLRMFNYKYRAGLGLDIFYAENSNESSGTESTFSNTMSLAAVGSWEWVLTKNFYVPVGIGIYLHRNEANDENTPYYERVGIRYRFTNNIFAGLTIKAHGGKADIFEWTVGYTFYKDKNTY